MKLKSFRIKNYKSISDTGEVLLSPNDSIVVFAGQNESGKSSILEALNAYEQGKFELDSKPFTTKGSTIQSVSCTFEIKNYGDFITSLTEVFKDNFDLTDIDNIFEEEKISNIKHFTLTRTSKDGKVDLEIEPTIFKIVQAAIIEKDIIEEEKQNDESAVKKIRKEKIINLKDEDQGRVASVLWACTPKIILFNDFCDLLPDRITLAELKAKNKDAKGYRAVKNLEKVLGVDFVSLYEKDDLEREALRDEHNEKISVDFQKAWGQKIHNTNKFEVKYDFEKRESDNNSYVNFYIETRDRQKIKPRLRSKGVVWFLSFWLELNAQDGNDYNLIILADEPGLYLHIKAQNDILQLFQKLADKGHGVMYTTHSPNLIQSKYLNRVNLVLNDPKLGTIIEPVTTAKIDSENKKDALQPIAHAIGLEITDFSSLGKKNVILEGLSDFYYFSAMRKILDRKDDYSFLPGIGVRKIESLISLCIGHGCEWLVIIDDDPTTGGNDSLSKFNEIKEYIFDGDEEKAKEKVYIPKRITGIENMFKFEDLKLVDENILDKTNLSESVGKNRKVLFAKLFYEKVDKGEITKTIISTEARNRFDKAFDFIQSKFHLQDLSQTTK